MQKWNFGSSLVSKLVLNLNTKLFQSSKTHIEWSREIRKYASPGLAIVNTLLNGRLDILESGSLKQQTYWTWLSGLTHSNTTANRCRSTRESKTYLYGCSMGAQRRRGHCFQLRTTIHVCTVITSPVYITTHLSLERIDAPSLSNSFVQSIIYPTLNIIISLHFYRLFISQLTSLVNICICTCKLIE